MNDLSLQRSALALALSSTVLALTACGGGDGDTPSATTPIVDNTPQAVTIDLAATVGANVLSIDKCSDVTVSGVSTRDSATVNAKLSDLRFYLSNVKLIDASGNATAITVDESAYQANLSAGGNLVLVDMEDGTCVNGTGTAGTNAKITGTVPKGTYVGLSFELGVPESVNHTDPTASTTPKPLNSDATGMGWSWQSGRKFTKVELSPENATTAGTYTGGVQVITAGGAQATTTDATTGVTSNVANTSLFVYHLGNTGCVADAAATSTGGYTCSGKNQTAVTVSAFNADTQRLSFDLQAFFSGNTTTQNTVSTSPGCMSATSDPQCTPMYAMLTAAKTGSTVFRAIGK